MANKKTIDWDALKAPFQQNDVKYRIQTLSGDQNKALFLPYIDGRAVQNRLDAILSPECWKDDYVDWQMPVTQLDMGAATTAGVDYNGNADAKRAASFTKDYYDKSVKCILSVKVDGEWIPKCGIASNTDIQSAKGGESGSLRRAAVKFGIGRYLYDLPDLWLPISKTYTDGKESVYFKGDTRYFSKPDLTRFTGPTGATETKPASKSANDAIKNAGTKPEAKPSPTGPDGSVPENTEHGGPQAISTAEFKDWQTRLAPLAQGNPTSMQMIGLSAKETDSLTKCSKLLGAAYSLFDVGSKEQLAITEVMTEKQLPDMVTVLKNSLIVLESK